MARLRPWRTENATDRWPAKGTLMRHNGRAPLLLSTLRSDCVTVDGDEIRSVVCADCGTWRVVRRGMVAAHRAEPRSNQPADRRGQRKAQDRVPRCEGSGQRIKV